MFKPVLWITVLLLAACAEDTEQPSGSNPDELTQVLATPLPGDNPFARPSPLQLNTPQFDLIREEHFFPAFLHGMEQQRIEIDAIASQSAAPTFANTIAAMELSGQMLNRVSAVFDNYVLVVGGDELIALQQRVSPLLASHDHQIVRNRSLFQRIEHLYDRRNTLALDSESLFLLEKYHQGFSIAGAAAAPQDQRRLAEIDAELELLQTIYSDNSVQESTVLAEILDLNNSGINSLHSATDQEFLASIESRQQRQRIYEAAVGRGSNATDHDNRQLLLQILILRAEKAELLGVENFATLIASQQSVRTTNTIDKLLGDIVPFAVAAVERDAELLQEFIDSSDKGIELAAWDWRYYAAKKQQQENENNQGDFDFNPYFELENVLNNGVFFAAEQLYGISFSERFDLPLYHEDVRVFEVFDTVGTSLGLFIADYYSRNGKMSGAWTNSYVSQSELLRNQAVVANHLNLQKPAGGQFVLLSFDEVETLFHEFGHALQSLFSEVHYPYFSGSRVVEDFVEYAGLANEMWAKFPSVLNNYARHFETGEPLPEAQKALLLADTPGQSYFIAEVLGSALLDQALHKLSFEPLRAGSSASNIEQKIMQQSELNVDLVPPRYGSHYFLHIMGGFAGRYYTYVLNDVLEADTHQWFSDNGGLTRQNGDTFRRQILSKGGTENGLDLYNQFRGRALDLSAYLSSNGLE